MRISKRGFLAWGWVLCAAGAASAGMLAGSAEYGLACPGPPPSFGMAPGSISFSDEFATGPLGGFSVSGSASAATAGAGSANPVHNAATQIAFDDAFIPPGATCLFATGSRVTQVWKGTRPSDPLGIGITRAELSIRLATNAVVDGLGGPLPTSELFRAQLFVRLESPAAQAVNLAMVLFSDGSSVVDPGLDGITVTPTQTASGWSFDVRGEASFELSLPYGPDGFELGSDILQEVGFQMASATPAPINGFVELGEGTVFEYTIRSLDPEVVFAAEGAVIPEPGTAALLAAGLALLAWRRGRHSTA